ncbi:6-carboxytetrahydropterin synthase [Pseudomonas fluorescens]|uniref:6-carboxytetrahydropterin synthase n=1 Tax=Pseudomonas fluorescens TaxID=294 RepID=UPI001CA40966|nr:6-carboxytetrahydropterin synthase [Pseudomonas fluorescens]
MSTATIAPPYPSSAAEAMVNSNSNTICELSQRFYFEAAHTLNRGIETESSRRIHGHTYEAEVTVAGQPDANSGMLIDLGYLRSEIARVREMLDHRLLDEVEDLGPATIENLCAFIRKQLENSVTSLCAVMVERRLSGDRCVLRWTR